MARPVPSPPKRWGRACTFEPAWYEKGVYGRYAWVPKHTTPRFEDRSRAHEPGTAPPQSGGPEVASVGRSATTASFEVIRVTDPERGESHPLQRWEDVKAASLEDEPVRSLPRTRHEVVRTVAVDRPRFDRD